MIFIEVSAIINDENIIKDLSIISKELVLLN
jgi:hypothetical protein